MYGVEMICFTSEGIAHRSFIELLDDNNPRMGGNAPEFIWERHGWGF